MTSYVLKNVDCKILHMLLLLCLMFLLAIPCSNCTTPRWSYCHRKW